MTPYVALLRSVGVGVVLVGCAPHPATLSVARAFSPAALATWSWPKAAKATLHEGVTRWEARTDDGTDLELIEFDFSVNPRSRFELYDGDENDAVPFDNRTDYHPRGVGRVTKDLNARGNGRVVAAWNGLFFAYDRRVGGPNGIATHIGPNVIRGKVRYNVGNHRWAFGVKRIDGKPRFEALHLPDKATLAREFDFAAVGAQCVVREGKPLRL